MVIAWQIEDRTRPLYAILILRGAQHRALIMGLEDPAQLERRTRVAVRLFLDGCRPR